MQKQTWQLTIQSPIGEQLSTLEIDVNGESFSGTLNGEAGTTDIMNGQLTNNKYSWSIEVDQPIRMTLNFEGLEAAGEMQGTVQFGAFSSGEFSARLSQ